MVSRLVEQGADPLERLSDAALSARVRCGVQAQLSDAAYQLTVSATLSVAMRTLSDAAFSSRCDAAPSSRCCFKLALFQTGQLVVRCGVQLASVADGVSDSGSASVGLARSGVIWHGWRYAWGEDLQPL